MPNRDQEVESRRVTLEFAGPTRRCWTVRLPKGIATADDLKDPNVWCRIQDNPNVALARHDEVYCIAFDETWALSAVVTDATRTSALLAFVKLIQLGQRTTPLFSDEKYRVVWTGGGFSVMRIADGQFLGGEHGSESLAIADIRSRYPARVA